MDPALHRKLDELARKVREMADAQAVTNAQVQKDLKMVWDKVIETCG